MADPSEGASAAENWPQQQSYAAPATGTVGRPHSPGMQILLFIITLGIWFLVWVYRQYEDTKNYSGEGVGAVLGLVLQIFVGIVTPFLLAYEVENNLYQPDGRESPVHTITGLWSLIPIVGFFIWYIKVQRALNEFWISKGAPAPA